MTIQYTYISYVCICINISVHTQTHFETTLKSHKIFENRTKFPLKLPRQNGEFPCALQYILSRAQ